MQKSAFPVLLLFFLLSIGVIFVSQKQQELRTRASASSTLAFVPSTSIIAPITKRVGDTVAFDVMLSPGDNDISTVKVHITYDSSIFEVPQKTGFEVNSAAFPSAVEGPVINNDAGSVIATFFVGADHRKAITAPTKIGTVRLTAVKETNNLSSTKIFFEDTSQAYSISSQDYAYENVIATTTPAYVVVRPKDTAPVPTPTVAISGKTGGTKASIVPTSTVVPTQLPIATPVVTLVPTQVTKEVSLPLKIFFTGVGKQPLENNKPAHTTRYAKILLENTKSFVVTYYNLALGYEESDGSFVGTLSVPDLETGNYIVRIVSDGYLEKEIAQKQLLQVNSRNTIVSARLLGGDINADGELTIVDYNLMLTCALTNVDSANCNNEEKTRADMDDNGKVDENDFFIFVKQNE